MTDYISEGEPPTPTRTTLLARLKAKDDGESWQKFFEIYSGLIYNVARRAGLADAKDIVQETTIKVCQGIDRFEIRHERGAFKAWLATVTRSRINNFFKRQSKESPRHEPLPEGEDPVELVPDPKAPYLETV